MTTASEDLCVPGKPHGPGSDPHQKSAAQTRGDIHAHRDAPGRCKYQEPLWRQSTDNASETCDFPAGRVVPECRDRRTRGAAVRMPLHHSADPSPQPGRQRPNHTVNGRYHTNGRQYSRPQPSREKRGKNHRAVHPLGHTKPREMHYDLESFCQEACPKLKSQQGLILKDLWDWFQEPSLFGIEVPTCGCEFGRSSAFFVPMLSAMRIFTRWSDTSNNHQQLQTSPSFEEAKPDAVASATASPSRACRCNYQGEEMQLVAEYYESKLPWDRPPLYLAVQELALATHDPMPVPGSVCRAVPAPAALFDLRLSDIHPCSWFAVLWQPLYRIPEMPLDARFLAYYTFEPGKGLIQREGACHLRVVGLICGGSGAQRPGDGREHWLKPHWTSPSPSPDSTDDFLVYHGQHSVRDGSPRLEELNAVRTVQDDVRKLYNTADGLTRANHHWVKYPEGHTTYDLSEAHSDFWFMKRSMTWLDKPEK